MARAKLEREYAGYDSDDTKALGYLALDAAAVAGIVVAHTVFRHIWFWSALTYAVAAALLLIELRQRRLPTGPDPDTLYFGTQHAPILDAIEAYSAAAFQVERVRRSRARRWTHMLSVGLTIGASVGTATAYLVLH